MALYAHLNESGIVTNIIVADENFMSGFAEKEFYVDANVDDFSSKPRTAIGMFYDSGINTFLPPKPFPSWVLTEEYQWTPPVNPPTGLGQYEWSEEITGWIDSNHPTEVNIVLPSGWLDAFEGLTGLSKPQNEDLTSFQPKDLPTGVLVLPPPPLPIPDCYIDLSTDKQ